MMRWMVIIVVVFGLMGGPALGDTGTIWFNPDASTANWCDAGAWVSDGCDGEETAEDPGANAVGVICAGKTCNVNCDPTVNAVIVEETAVLNIQSGRTLTLDNDGSMSTFDGTANLTGEIHINWSATSGAPWQYTFNGDGDIIGTASSAKVLIERYGEIQPNQLILSTTIRGIGEIGKLPNAEYGDDWQMLILKGGTVHADADGTLLIDVSFMKDDSAAGERSLLKVSTHSNAVLKIDVSCPDAIPADTCRIYCLEYTDAEILEGTLDLDTAILTKGDLTMEPGGIIDVAALAGASFRLGSCP